VHLLSFNIEQSLLKVQAGLAAGISGDLLGLDIRHALQSLGEITGEILHDRDILGTIFGKFCIGK
jgi:tRNA modification GTPase